MEQPVKRLLLLIGLSVRTLVRNRAEVLVQLFNSGTVCA